MSLLKRIGGTPGTPGNESTQPGARGPGTSRPETLKPSSQDENVNELKVRVQTRLLNELDPKMDLGNTVKVRQQVEEIFNSILDSESIVLTRSDRVRMFESIAADIIGFGPLEQLLNDSEVTEIMVNGPRRIYVEKRGKVQLSNVTFNDDAHVLRVIDRIVAPLGRRIDESSPMVDARLPNGSRVNAVIRPIALCGPTLSIRKLSLARLPVRWQSSLRRASRHTSMLLSQAAPAPVRQPC
jgi:pilus assembly protein CpaF